VDPLVIRSLEFMGGMAGAGGWRPDSTLPEIAFAGRSNVGKSSLLNALVRRKAFARVSKTPGRTREINFFKVNDRFLLADLPGYGYARVSKSQSADWGPLIESYLRRTTALRGVVQLLDVRHEPTHDDHRMFDFLADVGVPTLFVATKTDKLSKSAAKQRLRDLAGVLDVEEGDILPFSATTGEGRTDLAAAVVSLLESESPSEAREP
ncbi:MAG TPA: ribosome biogenesis GTP-binding protein YihA/YsxC, partial [Candidatus Elarobacter sp.]|nr:ribosome biogenesis GTP-binding protein YihA/YsxC [Candidatus Elarobacter sp.]